jgi:hypothetical protein
MQRRTEEGGKDEMWPGKMGQEGGERVGGEGGGGEGGGRGVRLSPSPVCCVQVGEKEVGAATRQPVRIRVAGEFVEPSYLKKKMYEASEWRCHHSDFSAFSRILCAPFKKTYAGEATDECVDGRGRDGG